MASSFAFHLVVAVLLVLVHQQAAGKPHTFDLYKAVERFVERMGKMCNREIVWWDVHRKQDEVKGDRRKYPPVTVTAGPVVYGAAKSSAKQPSIVYDQRFNNGGLTSLTATVEEKVDYKTTAAWHVEAGFSYFGSVTANARILVVDIGEKHQISLGLKGGHREEVSDTETFSLNQVITVKPRSSVKVEWIMTDIVTEVPWTSTVTATGHIAIKYKEKLEGRFLWYYNLFNLQDSRLKDAGNNMFLYTAKGTFTAVRPRESVEIGHTDYDNQTNTEAKTLW